tara:strand:+ start:526 stop:699 length:174 start_codon:yes stop_codon:yes gene_type:complete
MPSNDYHLSYYKKNKNRLQEYQRNYYYSKKASEEHPETVDPKQWITITRGTFVLKFD